MNVIKLIDKILLLIIVMLVLLSTFDVWLPLDMRYIYICYFLVRWVAIPIVLRIRRNVSKDTPN